MATLEMNVAAIAKTRTVPSRVLMALSFIAIYVIWGSTYLAIRYAVETIPPFITVGIRQSIAGLGTARCGPTTRISSYAPALVFGDRRRSAVLFRCPRHAALGGTVFRLWVGSVAGCD